MTAPAIPNFIGKEDMQLFPLANRILKTLSRTLKTKMSTTTKCPFRMSYACCLGDTKLTSMNGTFGIRPNYFALSGLDCALGFNTQGGAGRLSPLTFALGYFVSALRAISAASLHGKTMAIV